MIPIYHAGEEDGLLYVTMRFVDGTDLARLLRERKRLDPVHAAQLVAQVAGALDAAHQAGIVHRDIKPANVLIEGEDGNARANATDFGLMKDTRARRRSRRRNGHRDVRLRRAGAVPRRPGRRARRRLRARRRALPGAHGQGPVPA